MSGVLLNSRRREAISLAGFDQQQQQQQQTSHENNPYHTNIQNSQHNQLYGQQHMHQQQQQPSHQQQQPQSQQQHDSFLPSLIDRSYSPNNGNDGRNGGGYGGSNDFIPQQVHHPHHSHRGSGVGLPLIQYDHEDDPTIIPARGGSAMSNLQSMSFANSDRFGGNKNNLIDTQQQQQHHKYQQQQQQDSYRMSMSSTLDIPLSKDFSFNSGENLNSFTSRDYLERTHTPVDRLDPLDHTFAPSNNNSNNSDSLLNLTSHLSRNQPHHHPSSHSSLTSLSSVTSRSDAHRFGSMSDTLSLRSSQAPSGMTSGMNSGMSSLSANELGWIKEEIERSQRDPMQHMQLQQRDQQQREQLQRERERERERELQQQQQQPLQSNNMSLLGNPHGNGSGSNSAPGSNRATLSSNSNGNPDSLSPSNIYETNSGGLLSIGSNAANLLNSGGGVMDETKLKKYKTVMCQRMVRTGGCRYGALCDFAHDRHELRRNLDLHWYFAVKCERRHCIDPECRYAHNDHEVMYHPRIYKSRYCSNYTKPGGCNRKMYCSFAHGKYELRLHNNTNLLMGGPTNIFGSVPPQPGVTPQPNGSPNNSNNGNGGTTLTIEGGSQVLPRELVASLQASGINISAPGQSPNSQERTLQPSASPQSGNLQPGSMSFSARGSTSLLGMGPGSNAALNKKFQQQGGGTSPRPSQSPAASDLSKENFTLGLGGQNGGNDQYGRDGASSPSPRFHASNGPPDLSPQFATLGLGASAAAIAASIEDQQERESFRESTDHLKIRILDLVDEVAAAHYQRAMDDQAVAMANGTAFKTITNTLQATTIGLANTKSALSIYTGDESALASLSPTALDALTSQLQSILASVGQAKSKLDSLPPTPPQCLMCQTEAVTCMIWPCTHRVLCSACHPDACPVVGCNVPITRTIALQPELPNIPALLSTPTPSLYGDQRGKLLLTDSTPTPSRSTVSSPIGERRLPPIVANNNNNQSNGNNNNTNNNNNNQGMNVNMNSSGAPTQQQQQQPQ